MQLRLSDVSDLAFAQSLENGQFRLRVGEITIRLETRSDALRAGLRQVYSHYPVSVSGGFYDFDLGVHPASLLRRWFRRNVVFSLSGARICATVPFCVSNAKGPKHASGCRCLIKSID